MNHPKTARNQTIATLFNLGVPIRLIATRFGLSIPRIAAIAKEQGCPRRYSKNQQLELPLTYFPETSPTSNAPRTNTKSRLETLFGPIAEHVK